MSGIEDSGKKFISAGPWGGQDGMAFDDGVYSGVKQVVIHHGTSIDSIQIEYDKQGATVWSNRHGGRGGFKTDNVKLDYPDEVLTSINGHYGKLQEWGPTMVRSLTLKSNKKTYGPFGIEQGTCFSFPMNNVKIVGFHGIAGWSVDAIGAHLKPIDHRNSDSNKILFHSQNYTVNAASENLNGFSVIQGSVGQSYDIVLAVRQRSDDFSAKEARPLPKKISESDSTSDSDRDSSDVQTKDSRKKIMPKAGKAQAPLMVEGAIKCGPWGGSGGAIFEDGWSTGIKQINISRNVGVVYIRVLYDRNGESVWGPKHGGKGGFKHDKVIFDYPNEVLTHITGSFSPAMVMGPNVIKSLTFHTNKGKHGPFGEEQGTRFTTKVKEGKIVGFHGRSGIFLDALGVHLVECNVGTTPDADSPNNSKAIVPVNDHKLHHESSISEIDHPQWRNKLVYTKRGQAEEVACGVVKEPSPCGPGPWGGDGGRPWDDGVYSGIKQIYLTRSDDALCSIQIEYDRNGQSIWSVKHGSDIGNRTHRIKLTYPNEVLIRVSGYFGGISKDEKSKVIRSLTFYTSRGQYGPFGDEIGTYFTSTTTEGKLVGFHGRSSLYLDAIGVHMQLWLGNQKTPKSSLFKFI